MQVDPHAPYVPYEPEAEAEFDAMDELLPLRDWLIIEAGVSERYVEKTVVVLDEQEVDTVPDLRLLVQLPVWQVCTLSSLTKLKIEQALESANLAKLAIGPSEDCPGPSEDGPVGSQPTEASQSIGSSEDVPVWLADAAAQLDERLEQGVPPLEDANLAVPKAVDATLEPTDLASESSTAACSSTSTSATALQHGAMGVASPGGGLATQHDAMAALASFVQSASSISPSATKILLDMFQESTGYEPASMEDVVAWASELPDSVLAGMGRRTLQQAATRVKPTEKRGGGDDEDDVFAEGYQTSTEGKLPNNLGSKSDSETAEDGTGPNTRSLTT